LVEVKAGTRSLRSVRDGLLTLAYSLAGQPELRGVLLLVDTRITPSRIEEERQAARAVLLPEVLDRITVALWNDGRPWSTLVGLDAEDVRWLGKIAEDSTSRRRVTRPMHFEVLRVLVHLWLTHADPVTSVRLAEIVDCSQPTLARALKRWAGIVHRTSDRRVSLRQFPSREWTTLLAAGDSARPTLRYSDRSGQPRAPDALLDRLWGLQAKGKALDVAVGGVQGARHYYPELDLVGSPRMELSWHCCGPVSEPSFVSLLDPALGPVRSREEVPALVVHLLQRKESLFQRIASGPAVADPTECLLDLQEARLDEQAESFLWYLTRGREQPA
jgi:hypothetical protein